jgi:hypothetical protein
VNTSQQFVTTTSILKFGGASIAVLAVSLTLQHVLATNWILIPFGAAFVVGFVVVGVSLHRYRSE